jgi:xanthine dehydrogenase accessory factor
LKNLVTWKFILDSLERNIQVILLFVLESRGSSPGRQGFCMAVNAEGIMEGSIGGGVMEHKFVELAKENLKEQASKAQVRKQVHDKSATRNRSGMICSGEQTLLIYPVSEDDRSQVQRLVKSIEQNKNGELRLSPAGILFSDTPAKADYFFEIPGEDWLYKERTGLKNNLVIVGGGHCSLALSKLMSNMEFHIQVYEERAALNTMERNHFAHEKITVDGYESLKEIVSPGANTYVVIMSFGYRTDYIALKALLPKKFKYLGLLGSKKKIGQMFDDLRKEGFPEETISKISSPVGIQIKSETPEEIAVSIAAEIIRIKNAFSSSIN